jgi:hypothetical protein
MLKNKVLRRKFGPKIEEVTGEWRKLHNEELNDLHSSPNVRLVKSRMIKWVEHVARMGNREGAYSDLVGNLRHGDHWEDPGVDGDDNIKMDHQKVGWGIDWIYLVQDRNR